MRKHITLPYDILALIVYEIWTQSLTSLPGGNIATRTLVALSQTCKLMLPLCHRYLFASVKFDSRRGAKTKELMDLLRENPTVARYVQSLQYTIREPADEHRYEYGILDTLHRFSPSLWSIRIGPDSYDCDDESFAWNVQPGYIQALLISLMQLPNVTSVTLSSLHSFPAFQLLHCRGLKNLCLDNMTSFTFAAARPITASRSQAPAPLFLEVSLTSWAALASVMDPARRPNLILDLSHVQNAIVTVGEDFDVEILGEVFKTATQLETLTLEVESSSKIWITSLGTSLAANVRPALWKIRFFGYALHSQTNPLWGFNLALKEIAGRNNVLEVLHVEIIVYPEHQCHTDSDDFTDLDRVLTERGGFPMLRRVSFHITWYYKEGESDSEYEKLLGSLNKLTRTRFPRLARSSEIQFTFFEDEVEE
ncbi:hypothetical protein HYPSUDRAFT_41854 [Hypholoma sublateritium FD-334 SS-4]|uniref:F-box domain-containing protein n=1 Tax=Hypholoma sublateritium (strain FD-334 SS-4) TaxID=945553 RepID=A0A0D2NZ45_HYPSF|nr:hypothetical protein HYPSUDRAFT_41854 [Hypholoma sublateritium FD-334 SS-4]